MSQPASSKERPPVTNWATDFDILDLAWVRDPYAIFNQLRAECPIAHTDRYHGVYLPTRYADIRDIAYDTERFSSRVIAVREQAPAERERGGGPPIEQGKVSWHVSGLTVCFGANRELRQRA